MDVSEDRTEHWGGCLCGAVRFRIIGSPIMAGHCHCLSCQKLSGSGHAFHAMVGEEAFEVSGETRGFSWTADSGNTVTTSFCPTCGSPLFGRSSGYPGMVTFRVASLDDPSVVRPQMAVYAKRLQPWDHLDPGLPAFPGMPPASGGR
ncbi:MAG: GFA family protein [Proteobacteria bacterium]|nr:GFA family protein [Pseudomonadota bacterium]